MVNKLNMQLLLDSSVIVKWYINESQSDSAHKLRELFEAGDLSLVMADLSFYEVADALRNANTLPLKYVHQSMMLLEAQGIPTVRFEYGILQVAIEIARSSNISVYDAYYVALADLEGLRLITADVKLANAVKGQTDVMTLQEYAASLN